MPYCVHLTNQSSPPNFLKTYLATSLGTHSKAFLNSTKANYKSFSMGKHVKLCQDEEGISSSSVKPNNLSFISFCCGSNFQINLSTISRI